jgi:hypothetical protein
MNELIINEQNIQNKIYTIHGVQVMLDRDLAELYDVQTGRLNEQVKRNIDRFPNDFMFQLSKEEFENWKSQNAMSNSDRMGLRRSPYAFTEQGVSMLSSVLKSKVAVDISVKIIRTFVNMRKMINSNTPMFERFERVEQRLSLHDENFDTLFKALEDKSLIPIQGIFYNGQTFDAYKFVNDLIKSAKTDIKLLDNYIDETVLTLFSKVSDIKVTIYTKTITKQLKLDLEKYNSQYNNIEIKKFDNSHDRFLIIDENEVYHIGASLKDLGKNWFAFSRMDEQNLSILGRLK